MRYLSLLVAITTMAACKKDKNPPLIELFGNNPDTVIVKTMATYKDPGAKAHDAEDGDVELIIATNMDTQKPGRYSIYYNARDKQDNMAQEKTRQVSVIKADGNYSCHVECASSGASDLNVTVTSNSALSTISLDGFPVNTFVTQATVKEGGFEILQQDLGSIVSISGSITTAGTLWTADYTQTTLIGPPATESCTAVFRKN